MSLAAGAAAQGLPWEKIKLSEAVRSVKFGGDFRLRHDSSYKRGADTNDRSRLRYRLRAGLDVQLPKDVLLNLRLASGTGEQVSTNQSFDNLGTQKDLWVDTVFLKWTPKISDAGAVHLTGGRMVNQLWRIYSSDLVWDDDFNPEGIAEGVEWRLPGGRTSVFANALQMVADEDSNSGKNQWLYSQQVGFETALPLTSRIRAAVAYHKWSDENRSSLSANAANDGNRRTANNNTGILLNRFRVLEATAQVSGRVRRTPLSIQATAARNLGTRNNETTVTGPWARDGYQFGAILGKAGPAGSWEVAYFRKYAQTDVTVADISDSDFGDGGTNRTGHISWLAYSPQDWIQLKAKYFVTDTLDRRLAPGDKAVNRLQLDAVVKF